MTRFTSLVTRSLLAFLIGGGIHATNLYAQSDAITVSVPFSFTVGRQDVAPGTYRFSLVSSRMESSQFVLSLRDVRTGNMELFEVRPEQQPTVAQHGYLLFHKSAGRSVLNEVHFPGTDTFSELIPPRRGAKTRPTRALAERQTCVAQR